MLLCDTFAAFLSCALLVMLNTDTLRPWHLYVGNALTGLMNTVQNPASEVAMSLVVPKVYYQKTSGMRSFSSSLIMIFNPVIATAVYGLLGMTAVIVLDLTTFAFVSLLFVRKNLKEIYF